MQRAVADVSNIEHRLRVQRPSADANGVTVPACLIAEAGASSMDPG